MQIARLRVAFILSGDAVGGDEESAACCSDSEEDAVAAAEVGVLVRYEWDGKMVASYLRKDMMLDE